MVTQLVFEHALRVRMTAEAVATGLTHPTPGEDADEAPRIEPTIHEQHMAEPVAEAEAEEEEPHRSDGASPTASESNTNKSTPQGPSGGVSNLVGRINNLVTADLQMLDNGRDFIALCASFLRCKRRVLLVTCATKWSRFQLHWPPAHGSSTLSWVGGDFRTIQGAAIC